MRINNNISALNAWRNLVGTDNVMSRSLERLSSGLRINKAADDAAGLAISEKMRGQIRGLNQAVRNAQDAISLIQTAEGALNESQAILQRMRELAVQAASDSSTNEDRQQIQKEVDTLAEELSRISNTSEFNTKNLLAGGFTGQRFFIGANAGQDIEVNIGAMDAFSLGVTSGRGAYVASGTTVTSAVLSTTATISAGFYTIDGTITTAATTASRQVIGDATNNITVTATKAGADGNTIQIEFVDNNTTANNPLSVSVSGTTITVELGNNSTGGAGSINSTYQQVVDAINNTSQAAALVTASVGGTTPNGTATATTAALASLTGGADAIATVNLKNSSGTTVSSLTGQSVGTTVAFTNGLSVSLNKVALNTLALNASIASSSIEVVTANSSAATTGANGSVITKATVAKGILVNTQANASSAITSIEAAVTKVSNQRSALGAVQNRLEYTIRNLSTASENLSAAESRVRDVDMAMEMASFTRSQILLQAGTAMMAQANAKPQAVLQLLR